MLLDDLLFLTFRWNLLSLIVLMVITTLQAVGVVSVPWWAFATLAFVGSLPFMFACWISSYGP